MQKAKAVVEVVIIFSLTLLLIALVSLSPIGRWERQVSNRFFVEYGVMVVFPLLLLVAARRNLAAYGLSLRNVLYHLDIAATAFVPVAFASVPFAFVDYRQWSGSLILAGVQIAVLFVLGWLLKRKPTQNENGVLVGTILPTLCLQPTLKAGLDNAISAIVFYIFFLGLGEELLFRGYIQSRLNAAFGKPFRFFGVNWGWGIVIASALFGLMHILNLGSLVSGHWQLVWWWGFWTFFGGLVLGFVREKSGSIVAPMILHGLPQAIAYTILGL
ncbi:MAG: CPBP family intramembrane glutamic endopeptidase [Anaerolineales bacterium]